MTYLASGCLARLRIPAVRYLAANYLRPMVAIRGLFWQDRTLHLPAGGGLVAGSVFDNEWAELELKRNWVRQAFHLDSVHA